MAEGSAEALAVRVAKRGLEVSEQFCSQLQLGLRRARRMPQASSCVSAKCASTASDFRLPTRHPEINARPRYSTSDTLLPLGARPSGVTRASIVLADFKSVGGASYEEPGALNRRPRAAASFADMSVPAEQPRRGRAAAYFEAQWGHKLLPPRLVPSSRGNLLD